MGSFGNGVGDEEKGRGGKDTKVNSMVMVGKEFQSRSSKLPTATEGWGGRWGVGGGGQGAGGRGQCSLSIYLFFLSNLHGCMLLALEWNQLYSHMLTKAPVM